MKLPPPIDSKNGFAKFIAGFSYALQGLAYAVRTQRNIRVQIGIALLALAGALLLRMPLLHVCVIIFLITIVLAAELLNTAIETLVDLVSPEVHPLAKIVKDVSAAGVLVCAFGALVIGMLLFGAVIESCFK